MSKITVSIELELRITYENMTQKEIAKIVGSDTEAIIEDAVKWTPRLSDGVMGFRLQMIATGTLGGYYFPQEIDFALPGESP